MELRAATFRRTTQPSDVSPESLDELRHVAAPVHPPGPPPGDLQARGGPPQHHPRSARRFTLRVTVRATEIADPTVSSRRASGPATRLLAAGVRVSSIPSASDVAAPSRRSSSQAWRAFGSAGIGPPPGRSHPGLAHPPSDQGADVLGQVLRSPGATCG